MKPREKELLETIGRLNKRVDELLKEASAVKDNTLYRRVRVFHQKFGHPVEHTPKVPDASMVKFRLHLIAEEFFELLAACEIWPMIPAEECEWCLGRSERMSCGNCQGTGLSGDPEQYLCDLINDAINEDFIDSSVVDLPKFIDAIGDIMYVAEGATAVMGVYMEPVIAEIHRANMDKDPVYVAAKDEHHCTAMGAEWSASLARKPDGKAKPTKSPDWEPPDVARILVEQGWKP